MNKAAILDLLHKNKGKLAVLIVFCAGGLRALDYHGAADALLTLGTLAGFGVLPNGQGYKR